MTLKTKVEIIGDAAGLKRATNNARKDLDALQGTAKRFSSGFKKAFAFAGISVGVTQITNAFRQAATAAVEDSKAQAVLAQSLRNSVGASSAVIQSVENQIGTWERQTTILDDKIRPAYAAAVRATGSVAKANKVMSAALDVSAGTGKDLTLVVKSISRALDGNVTGLQKLVPGIKITDDVLGALGEQFDGVALAAANTDPIARLDVVFNDLQEKIGTELLPRLNEVADYFGSEDGQKNLKEFTASVRDSVSAIKDLATVIGGLKPVGDAVFGFLNGLVAAFAGNSERAADIFQRLFSWIPGAKAPASRTTASASRIAGQRDPRSGGLDAAKAMIAAENAAFEDQAGGSGLDKAAALRKQRIKKLADTVRKAYEDAAARVKNARSAFVMASDVAAGVSERGDGSTVFRTNKVIQRMKRLLENAKNFAADIKALKKKGADNSLIQELISAGPNAGATTARELLTGGQFGEFMSLRKQLGTLGAAVGEAGNVAISGMSSAAWRSANTAMQSMVNSNNNTYQINLNKSNMSAADIIKEIKAYEKKSGKRVLVS